jgi:hypothetical protein
VAKSRDIDQKIPVQQFNLISPIANEEVEPWTSRLPYSVSLEKPNVTLAPSFEL